MADGDYLAQALKAKVVARKQDDGSWLCECGVSMPTDLAMFMHHLHDQAHKKEQVR